jgi:hypothetical protein
MVGCKTENNQSITIWPNHANKNILTHSQIKEQPIKHCRKIEDAVYLLQANFLTNFLISVRNDELRPA